MVLQDPKAHVGIRGVPWQITSGSPTGGESFLSLPVSRCKNALNNDDTFKPSQSRALGSAYDTSVPERQGNPRSDICSAVCCVLCGLWMSD